jgi:predicted N-acyltransferase
VREATAIAELPAAAWNRLAGSQPFLRHEFLHALEAAGCAAPQTGWTPQHLSLWRGDELVAALPCYAKAHSYGEFVFDWAWAEACERAGIAYYPKLLSAVPLTPVTGPRLLAQDDAARAQLIAAVLDLARRAGMSSWHVLFPDCQALTLLESAGLLLRQGVQFHWRNPGYRDFDDFLATLTRDKRRKIRQERRRVAEQGVELRRIAGCDIGDTDWEFFYRCHCRTYFDRGRSPYLNLDFFQRLGRTMPEALLLVLAVKDGAPIAAALDLLDDAALYGRYWGALEYVPGLHFEACYYQGIEHCIAQGLRVFEGGAQGEHKLARGFEPVVTHSAHWLAEPRLADAVARFLQRETLGVTHYIDELSAHSPFRREA